jgi:hypothetical protein
MSSIAGSDLMSQYRIPNSTGLLFREDEIVDSLQGYEPADTGSEPDIELPDEKELAAIQKAMSTKLKLTKQGQSVEVLRQNPANPLYSATSFEELHLPEELMFGLYDCGFRTPSRIQEQALPVLLSNP